MKNNDTNPRLLPAMALLVDTEVYEDACLPWQVTWIATRMTRKKHKLI